MQSPAGDVEHCLYKKGRCQLPDGSQLLWKPDREASCEYIPFQNVPGKLWNNQWVSDTAQILLTFHESIERNVCHYGKLRNSDQGVLIQEMSSQGNETTQNEQSTETPKNESKVRIKRQLETAPYIAAQFQKLRADMEDYVHLAFATAAYNLCKHTESSYLLLRSLMTTNPTLAARSLLGRKYIRAQMLGPHLEVFPCATIRNIRYEQSHCAPYIRVIFANDKQMFKGTLDPITNIVSLRETPRKHRGERCHKELIPFCARDRCYYYVPKKGTLLPAPIPTKEVGAYATDYLNLPEMHHSVYHQLNIYNMSTLTQHITTNEITATRDVMNELLATGKDEFESFISEANEDTDISYDVSPFKSYLSLSSLGWYVTWQLIVCVIVTIEFMRRLCCCGARSAIKLRQAKKQRFVAMTKTSSTKTGDGEMAEMESLCWVTPTAPPMNMEESSDNTDPPPSYSAANVKKKRTHRKKKSPAKQELVSNDSFLAPLQFEKWPINLSTSTLPTVAACGPNEKSVITAKVNKIPLRSLVDTGSYINILDNKTATQMGLKISKPNISARSVGGQSLPIKGMVTINIEIANKSYSQVAYVMEEAPFPLIIGVQCLKKLGKISIDYDKERMEFRGESTNLGSQDKADSQCFVQIAETICIPPNSEARIMGMIPPTKEKQALIEPKPDVSEKLDILIARVLVDTQESTVPLRILNPSKEPKTLYKHTRVATVEPFKELPPQPITQLPEADIQALSLIHI